MTTRFYRLGSVLAMVLMLSGVMGVGAVHQAEAARPGPDFYCGTQDYYWKVSYIPPIDGHLHLVNIRDIYNGTAYDYQYTYADAGGPWNLGEGYTCVSHG